MVNPVDGAVNENYPVGMSGFKDEKELWAWMRPQMLGKWERVECMFPAGFPDVFGSYNGTLTFIELKVGQPDLKALEAGQYDFMNWMQNCRISCYVVFGDPDTKTTRWWYWPETKAWKAPNFWRGPVSTAPRHARSEAKRRTRRKTAE
jgi:hypothetical protein